MLLKSLVAVTVPLVCLGSTTSPYYEGKIDVPCDTASAVYVPWTGFRIQLQRRYGQRFSDSDISPYAMRMTYCWQGSEYGLTYARDRPTPNESGQVPWVDWSSIFCISNNTVQDIGGCYRIARRPEYVGRDSVLRVPNVFVGGLFKCTDPEDCDNNDDVIPVLPLLTDEPYMTWFRPRNTSTPIQRIPLLYTPSQYSYLYPFVDSRWADTIDINEHYEDFELDHYSTGRQTSFKQLRRHLRSH
uniref:ARAD1D22704p n=1 Tax=Blastobotrys adeninivorans TaxID=409370 RepID=A0A060TAU1_BLAAD